MNETFLELLTHSLLIVGAAINGEQSSWSDGRTHYYWKFTDPITCKTTQVFMRDQELLKGRKVGLYYRVRDNFTGEVTSYGDYGADEITYIMPDPK
jgi:hypothetical protein